MTETPKSSRSLPSISSSEDFRFISIANTNTPKVAGNLTGNHRILRDCIADIYNAIQQWNNHFLNGVEILGQIKNIKFENFENNETYSSLLQIQCDSLDQVVNALSGIIDQLRLYSKTLLGLSKLIPEDQILFSTWQFSSFVKISQHILEYYQKEFALKKYVKENISHCKDKNTVAFYLICWLNQPYISDDLEEQIEAMLVETGHR